jgi:hypothetical protein
MPKLHCEDGALSDKMDDPITRMALSQYGLNKGQKLFGQDGIDAVIKELKQLHDRKVMEQEIPDRLSTKDKQCAALHHLMFLKKNDAVWSRDADV